jgi:hypothetical protein
MSVAAGPKPLTDRLVESRRIARQHRCAGNDKMADLWDAKTDRILDLMISARKERNG